MFELPLATILEPMKLSTPKERQHRQSVANQNMTLCQCETFVEAGTILTLKVVFGNRLNLA